MNQHVAPSDLELAALISSKICHDVIGPVGAINNGLEILDEEEGIDAKSYALDVIRNVTEQASAKLQFARFAFGAAGSAGSMIDLGTAQQISEGFVGKGKHKLFWKAPPGYMAKDRVKVLLNLIAVAITALPRGGDIEVTMTGSLESPLLIVDCKSPTARLPLYLGDFIAGQVSTPLDALSVQAYYTWRLAQTSGMKIEIAKSDGSVQLRARTS